ncbi:OLC1v1014998C1 [Oldenlandia corymbosa var. corymbosa]|uniref:OLC1v1014998C1 n=1 Tax=Oldenlandia corymbosa var. corymbosa TaxID=529605 RepID=A0AAV1E285_OLDCO|nr:OLC1v1014998C1 [Oldenlandia corymbosa var. corymbosa]
MKMFVSEKVLSRDNLKYNAAAGSYEVVTCPGSIQGKGEGFYVVNQYGSSVMSFAKDDEATGPYEG